MRAVPDSTGAKSAGAEFGQLAFDRPHAASLRQRQVPARELPLGGTGGRWGQRVRGLGWPPSHPGHQDVRTGGVVLGFVGEPCDGGGSGETLPARWAARIGQAARALAEIDLACAFADLASGEGWVRPRVDDSRAFVIEGGRHPVVERALRRKAESFVANDCDLTTGATPAIWLLTGPNMAGKSTFLRQNALIAVLAQAEPPFPTGGLAASGPGLKGENLVLCQAVADQRGAV